MIQDRISLRYLQKLRSLLNRIAPTGEEFCVHTLTGCMCVTCCCNLPSGRGAVRSTTRPISTDGDGENDKENENHHPSPSARNDLEAQDLMDQGPQTPLSPVTNTLAHSPGVAPVSPLNGGSVARPGGERTPRITNNSSIVRQQRSQTAGRRRKRKGRNRLSGSSSSSEEESEE